MEPERMQNKVTNTFTPTSTRCPWVSRAPITNTTVEKGTQNLSDKQNFDKSNNMSARLAATTANQAPSGSNISNTSTYSQNAVAQPPSMPKSSSEFFHFLRLMQLFPDVHPATLHAVLSLCKNDFFCAIDKLLFAKRCKELYNSRKNIIQRYSQSQVRYQPYNCHEQNRQYVNNGRPRPSTNVPQENFKNMNSTMNSNLNCQNFQTSNCGISDSSVRPQNNVECDGEDKNVQHPTPKTQ